MRTRQTPSNAKLDWYDHLMVGGDAYGMRSALTGPYPEYREALYTENRANLERALAGVDGPVPRCSKPCASSVLVMMRKPWPLSRRY